MILAALGFQYGQISYDRMIEIVLLAAGIYTAAEGAGDAFGRLKSVAQTPMPTSTPTPEEIEFDQWRERRKHVREAGGTI